MNNIEEKQAAIHKKGFNMAQETFTPTGDVTEYGKIKIVRNYKRLANETWRKKNVFNALYVNFNS